jgi:hypothetical protein
MLLRSSSGTRIGTARRKRKDLSDGFYVLVAAGNNCLFFDAFNSHLEVRSLLISRQDRYDTFATYCASEFRHHLLTE